MDKNTGIETSEYGDKLDTVAQKASRVREEQTEAVRKLEKLRDRARFALGQICLEDPEIWQELRPLIERNISALDPNTARYINDYEKIRAAIAKGRAIL